MRTSEILWRSAEDVYAGILAHPFLVELSKGELRREAFVRFVSQDYLYLNRYRSALAAAASRAGSPEASELLARMAADISSTELALHLDVLREHGVREEDLEPSPATLAYTSYLLALACAAPFEEALAALLACSWIYLEVGRELARRGPPPDPLYRRWVEQYSGEQYEREVRDLIALVDSLEVDGRALAAMRRSYRTAAVYEYMFWDDAYRGARFPYGLRPP